MRILLTLLGKETRALFSSSIATSLLPSLCCSWATLFTAFLFLNRAATLVHIFSRLQCVPAHRASADHAPVRRRAQDGAL